VVAEDLEGRAAPEEQARGWIVDRAQKHGKLRSRAPDEAKRPLREPSPVGGLVELSAEPRVALGARRGHEMRTRFRGKRGKREVAHTPSSLGDR
jgi:hypothetical protein